jgi:very-short-patch-repair endonuclease
LLDYLVVDEASQVDLLTAVLALSCCRNLVVVGDLQQLPHIASSVADGLSPPQPSYDYGDQSILKSLSGVFGDELPRTLLREHYRCDPAIIGFCNKSFYGGGLVPYTSSGRQPPMVVVRTSEGNHMRRHRAGGHSNQREIDVIPEEVIEQFCSEFADADIGITTPYRLQADKVGGVLDQLESDTVHGFQGRQKKVIILTTVLDETWRGRLGLRFVDDPHLVNVAVSRAAELFILVTNHDLLPASRHLRDLIGYIGYQSPDHQVTDSGVISVFDLLYREYSERLGPLARRLGNEMEYKSEDIIWTVLGALLGEQQYSHLQVAHHVLLRNLLTDLNGLTARQQSFVRHRASLDFVLYNRMTNDPVLAIEVDGFAFHENNPDQLARDAVKEEILGARGLPLLRLSTTGSGEERRIRQALDDAESRLARRSFSADVPSIHPPPARGLEPPRAE